MVIEKLVVSPLQENCYILGCEETLAGAIIDPGDEAARIINRVAGLGLAVRHVINTHGHVDHISAVQDIKEALGAKFCMHQGDTMYLEETVEHAKMFGIAGARTPKVDVWLNDGDTIAIGNLTVNVIHAPGHSPGGCLLQVGSDVFCGDLIFAGSIGRTDLPGGDYQTILETLETKILTLSDDTRLHPGHGPSTTVAVERQYNPFLQGLGGS